MQNSDSEDKDASQCQYNSQIKSLTQEDFDRFVNHLSEEDYKLMRDNNLLGNPGEHTKEELLRSLQWIKDVSVQDKEENAGAMAYDPTNDSSTQLSLQHLSTTRAPASFIQCDQNSTLPPHLPGTEFSSDGEYSYASVLSWLASFEEFRNMTDEERANLFWREGSLVPNTNSNNFRVSSRINFHQCESPGQKIEYVSSTGLLSEENLGNSQRQMQNLAFEFTSTGASRSEQGISEVLTEASSSRGQRRARSRSPEYRNIRPRIENRSDISRTNECLESFHYHSTGFPVHTLEDEDEADTLSLTQQEETLIQVTTALESQYSGILASSETTNAIQNNHSPHTNINNESRRLQQLNTILFDSELEVHPTTYSQRDSVASINQLIPERKINTVTLESEQGELQDTLFHLEQANTQSFDERSFNSVVTSHIYNPSFLTENTANHTNPGFNDPNNLVGGNEVDTSVSSPSQHMEIVETSNGFFISDLSSNSTTDVNNTYNFYSNVTPVSNFSFDYGSSSSYSTVPMNSSRNDYSNNRSLLFVENENSLTPLSPDSLNELLRGSRPMSPMYDDDDSDSWSSLNLDEFILLDYEDNEFTGLTKAQIDNFSIRLFCELDALKTCSVCLTEFTEGNKIRTLPCLHEYHSDCIDRWLLKNITCPICRRSVVDVDE